jgi:peptidoglycan/xylan/chitin deacetylase (PgdA/CDA1 family)
MFKRLLLPAVALIAGLASLPIQAADDAVTLMYHRFGEKGLPSTNTTMEQLDAHIAYLKAGKFTVWPLWRIVDAIRKGESLPDKTIALTIDDAYSSVLRYGLPRLKAAGFTATLFVNSEPADSALRGYMSWGDIRQALDDGFDIGAHTVSHAHLADLPLSEVRREIDHSNKRFQAELGFVPKLFAYPYGEASLDVREIIKEAGYIAAFGQHSGVLHKSEDIFYLPRFALNEKYGTISRFRTLASAKSMMVSDVTPRNMSLTSASNPPAFGFTIDPAIGSFSSLACYARGLGKLTLQRPGGRRIEARFPMRLGYGRHRVNCTLSAGGGRWYWFGRQFYVPKPQT